MLLMSGGAMGKGYMDVIEKITFYLSSVCHAPFGHSFLASVLLTREDLPEHFVVLTNMDKILLTCHTNL